MRPPNPLDVLMLSKLKSLVPCRASKSTVQRAFKTRDGNDDVLSKLLALLQPKVDRQSEPGLFQSALAASTQDLLSPRSAKPCLALKDDPDAIFTSPGHSVRSAGTPPGLPVKQEQTPLKEQENNPLVAPAAAAGVAPPKPSGAAESPAPDARAPEAAPEAEA